MKSSNPAKRKTQVLNETFTVVAIGASAGGLEAITELLQNLSSTTGMAFIFVQHLSRDHKSMLTSLLSKKTDMKVQEVEDMEKMKPNHVYVIPFDKEIEVTNGHIKLIPRPKNKPTNLSIDVLFSSLAETHKENVIGIILSGNGRDGTRGLKEIKLAGGITFVQDDSAKSSSMPHSAITEGAVDFVLSPKKIAQEIMSLNKRSVLKRGTLKTIPEDEIENSNPDLKNILQLILKRKNVDFSQYKMNTIKRRMLRRMLINKIKTIKLYAAYVLKKSTELDLLYKDLLINVTDFFRDTDAFMLLKKTVLTKLLKSKTSGETLRVWVAACSTGEEVYSIAMSLIELQDSKTNNIPFQIFASDLSSEAIKVARNGEYSQHQLKNVSPKRIQRFFTNVKDKYRVSQSLRDVCIFAQHNILGDPPFSRMDFISCRNFLIYLEAAAQKKVISIFHYALREGGCLMLGKSETIGTSSQLFSPLNKTYKLFNRKNYAGINRIPDLSPRLLNSPIIEKNKSAIVLPKKTTLPIYSSLSHAFDTILLSRYVPASVIINYDLEILQFRGQTSQYLMQSAGKASFNILKMVNTEIVFELRNAIHHAIKSNQVVRKVNIEVNRDQAKNTVQIINLEVLLLKNEGEEPLLMVIFTGQTVEQAEHPAKGKNAQFLAKDRRIKKLEEELASARYDMGSITHDQEVVNEELQSANEEVVSSNEELQSLNEELETSKEEIESTNEELTTTNHELNVRMVQVEELSAYNDTILSTIHEPMLILDKSMRVKSANASFFKMFHVKEDECLGIPFYKLGDSQWNIPHLRELLDELILSNKSFHDFEVELSFPVIGRKTMLLNAHKILQPSKNEELIVLSIVNITGIKELAIELQVKENKVLEVELEFEKKLKKEVEAVNAKLLEANLEAERKTKIAEEAVMAKQQFLSNMSHEIRTPLNAIVGFTNILLKSNLVDKQMDFLRAIKVSSDTLTLLVNDILDLAKAEAGKMIFEKRAFNLKETLLATLQLFELKLQENNLKLITEIDSSIPKVLVGDSLRLHQIILNLFSNAVKFTQKGSIKVSIKPVNADEEKVTLKFAIEDTGIGIAENQIEQIFEDFKQASTGTSRLYGGTGLGLAIVKKLIELQGGSIEVKSKPGEGSTFSFILTFEKTNAEPEEKNNFREPDTKIKGIKVLVIEDVTLNQFLVKTLLTEFGFECDIADNGKLGLEKLQSNVYDVILMDLQMPVMNGFEATDYIRNTIQSKIPIIGLTANVTTADIVKCKALGMDDYISKPIDQKKLYNKIVSLVQKTNPLSKKDSLPIPPVHSKISKYTDLIYMAEVTNSNPKLMMEMIDIYLKQTPPLIKHIKQSSSDKDWEALQFAVHKLIPSFSVVGISNDFENMAKQVQEDAIKIRQKASRITDHIIQLEGVCDAAFKELKEDYELLKNGHKF